MRMCCRNHIRAGVMNARMDREGSGVDRMPAFHDFALGVYQDQVGRADLPEMHTKRIDPEMIRSRRIARRNVSGNAFVETELGEQTECASQTFFAMASFLFHGCKLRNLRKSED